MNTHDQQRAFAVFAITIMWLVTAPAIYLFFTLMLSWPRDLVLLICIPIGMVWIPASYPLALAGTRRRAKDGELQPFSIRLLGTFAALGVLSGALSALAVWMYSMYVAEARSGLLLLILVAAVSIWLAARLVYRAVAEVGRRAT